MTLQQATERAINEVRLAVGRATTDYARYLLAGGHSDQAMWIAEQSINIETLMRAAVTICSASVHPDYPDDELTLSDYVRYHAVLDHLRLSWQDVTNEILDF